jgi:hypothetical protein
VCPSDSWGALGSLHRELDLEPDLDLDLEERCGSCWLCYAVSMYAARDKYLSCVNGQTCKPTCFAATKSDAPGFASCPVVFSLCGGGSRKFPPPLVASTPVPQDLLYYRSAALLWRSSSPVVSLLKYRRLVPGCTCFVSRNLLPPTSYCCSYAGYHRDITQNRINNMK